MPPTYPQIRLAAVGTGYFSRFHYDAWKRLGVTLAGVCSPAADEAAAMAADFDGARTFQDVGRMLDETEPDLVDIIVPPTAHVEILDQAIKRGIPAICQKPFTPDLTRARGVAAMARTAGATVVVHENFRFQPWYGEIRRLIEAGTLGQVYQVSFRLRPGDGQGPEAYLDRQPYFQDMERFLVHETAVHLIDVFRYLMGEIAAVTARLARLNPAIKGEDAGVIIFEHEDSRQSLFDGNRLADHAAENRRLVMGEMWVDGSDAVLTLDGDGRIFIRRHGGNEVQEHAYAWENRGFAGDSVYRLQAHVLDHLTTGAPVMNRAGDYLANLEVEEAVYRSNTEDRRVEISEIQAT